DRDMTITALPDSAAMLAAFSQGRVDGLSVSAPVSNMAARNFDGLMMLNTGIGEVKELAGFLGAALSAPGDWMKKNEELMVRFNKALWMAFDTMLDPARTNQARDALQKGQFKQIDAALFTDLWKDQVQGAPKTPAINAKMLQILIDFQNRFSQDK